MSAEIIQELCADICAIIFLSFFLVFCVVALIFSFKYASLRDKKRKEFLASLNDEQKALIVDYQCSLIVHFKELFNKHE